MSRTGRIVVVTAGVLVLAAGGFLAWRYLRPRPKLPASTETPPLTLKNPKNFLLEPEKFPSDPDPRKLPGLPLRPVDRQVFALLAKGGELTREQLMDAFPTATYKVKLVYSGVEHKIRVIAIDHDRDGKFDEGWQLSPGKVNRRALKEVKPGEATFYTLSYGLWLPR
jgi:hypothetical protein